MATLRLATGIANRHPVALAVCIRWIAVWLSNAAMRRLNVIAGYSYTIPFRGMLGKKRVAGRNEMGMVNVKGDFKQAGELLDKTLYLDPSCVAAYLEQAALCERAENPARARTLRRAALDIVRSLPGDTIIAPYETTAAELAQWLAQ